MDRRTARRAGGRCLGKIALDSLTSESHLYALGPMEGLRGEVSVFDGAACISRVIDGAIDVDASLGHRARFLVYAHVPGWIEVPCGAPIDGMERLETMALSEPPSTESTSPGRSPSVDRAGERLLLHVLDKRDGCATRRSCTSRPRCVPLSWRAGRGLGSSQLTSWDLYSAESNVHMHARLRDGRWPVTWTTWDWPPALRSGCRDRAAERTGTHEAQRTEHHQGKIRKVTRAPRRRT